MRGKPSAFVNSGKAAAEKWAPEPQDHFSGYLRTIIETAAVGMWNWDLSTRQVAISPTLLAIAGLPPGHETTMPIDAWLVNIHADDLGPAKAALAACLKGEAAQFEAEFRLVRPDEREVWVRARAVAVEHEAGGAVRRLVGSLLDIGRRKSAEEQLDSVAAMAGLGTWNWDILHNRITFNDFSLSINGYKAEEMNGTLESWEQKNHPDDRARIHEALQAYLSGEADSYSQEVRLCHKNGSYIWTQDTGRIIERNAEGRPTRMIGAHLNIDKLKRAELKLQDALKENEKYSGRLLVEVEKAVKDLAETQQFSNAMFNANPYINLIFDDKLRLTDCNPAAIEYFGYASKEELLQNLLVLMEESIPEFQPDGSPTTPLQERFDYALRNGFIEFENEFILRGSRVPMRITFKKIAHKGSFAIAAYLVDMQQLKEARNELMRQDYLLRQVNKVATKLISSEPGSFDKTLNNSLHILAASVGAGRMHIWENYEEDSRMMCRQIYYWEGEGAAGSDRPTVFDYADIPVWHKRLAGKKSINEPVREMTEAQRRLFAPKGTKATLIIPVFLMGAFWGLIVLDNRVDEELFSKTEERVIESGGILAVSAILRNQVNQRLIEAREAALASDQAKSDFLSRMSHEIRTPMNAIIGMTTIAQKTRDIDSIHYSLARIETASGQLLDIINDILDMSKIESGKLEINPVVFDFEEMMQSIFNVIQVRLEEKQQNFSYDFAGSYDRYMVCDDLRLSQVVINLLTNAVKFTSEKGHVALRVRYAPKKGCDDETYMLHVEVQDDGIGVSDEQQKKLFRSFEQADGGITRRFGGTGLGLAICKSIVNLMGGDIWIESEEGRGSTFIFEVEFRWGEALEKEDGAPKPPKAPEAYCWKGKTVLLVEDVDINREIVASFLEDTQVQIDSAENGRIAVEKYTAAPNRYDLILMDVQMPVLDGLGATRQIRASGLPGADTLPILAMTANAFNEDVQRCLDAGMNGHVAKPIDVDMLLARMAEYLGDA